MLLQDVFQDFYKFPNQIAEEGLPANGDEPALRPFNRSSCADLCWTINVLVVLEELAR